MVDYHSQELREKLTACQQFLVDSEFVRVKPSVLNLASIKNTPTFQKSKLQQVFKKLNCAAKVSLALEFVFCNVEDGKNLYSHAQEINLNLESSHLIANKEDMLEIQKFS